MPSRWACLLILVLWLASMSWLFQREIWPLLQPDIPPPYTIDLVDEARHHQHAEIWWSVYHDKDRPSPLQIRTRAATSLGLLVPSPTLNAGSFSTAVSVLATPLPFRAKTWVDYRERPDDTFGFHMEMSSSTGPSGKPRLLDLGNLHVASVKLAKLESHFRVNRLGQLREMEVDFKPAVTFPLFGRLPWNLEVHLSGKVVNEKFQAQYKVTPPKDLQAAVPPNFLKAFEGETAAVTLSYNGSMLLPYHPVNRIRGVRPGQKWRIPLFNPIVEALSQSFLPGSPEPRYLDAQVGLLPQLLPDTEEAISCLVIDSEGEDMHLRTWIQQNSGLVLRQEAASKGSPRLIMQRENIPREP